MSKNKLLALLLLPALALSPAASGESLISDELIQVETATFNETITAEKASFVRSYDEQGSEFYPRTCLLRFEGDSARFGEYLTSRGASVKAGDVLATFTLETDQVTLVSKQKTLLRTQENLAAQKLAQEESIQQQLEALALLQDPYEVEIQTLRIQRARIALEQYTAEQNQQIAALQQEIAELEQLSSYATLTAPFDGVITNITYKQTGDRVAKDEALITLCSTENMLLRVNNTAARFRYGMAVTVAVGPANARTTLTGTVVAADTMLPESQRSGYAYIQLDSFTGELPSAGAPPTVSVQTLAVEDVLVLPIRAVKTENGRNYVNKLSGGRIEKRYVNVGLRGISSVWILQGVEEGESIIID